MFEAEPDFRPALGLFRAALARAHASADPPFDPPLDFQPREAFHRRRASWRTPDRFPELHAAMTLVLEIFCRVTDGLPPQMVDQRFDLGEFRHAFQSALSK